LAREQLRITQAGIDVGKLAKTESLSVEQVIASREEELLLAEQNLADKEIELSATDRLETNTTEPDLDKTLASAMENNPQLKTVRAQGKQASIEVEVT